MHKLKTKDLVHVSLFAALMCLCAWLAVPSVVPFTLQTFALFLSTLLLGSRKTALMLLVYILLGAFGLPVFASGMAGPGVIFGPTGGYMLGWFFCPVVYSFFGKGNTYKKALSLGLGLVLCYLSGTVWYILAFGSELSGGFLTALSLCVFPYIIPDAVKLLLALWTASRVGVCQR